MCVDSKDLGYQSIDLHGIAPPCLVCVCFLVCGVLFLAAFCVVPPTGAGKMIAVTRQLLEFQMAYTEPLSAWGANERRWQICIVVRRRMTPTRTTTTTTTLLMIGKTRMRIMPFCLAFWHSTCLLTCLRLNQISRLVSVPTSFPFVGAQAAMWKKHHTTESSCEPLQVFWPQAQFGATCKLGALRNSRWWVFSWDWSPWDLMFFSFLIATITVWVLQHCWNHWCYSIRGAANPCKLREDLKARGWWQEIGKRHENDTSFRNRLFGTCAATFFYPFSSIWQ